LAAKVRFKSESDSFRFFMDWMYKKSAYLPGKALFFRCFRYCIKTHSKQFLAAIASEFPLAIAFELLLASAFG